MKPPVDLLQGTLDLLILKAVSPGGLHGYGVLVRLHQLTGGRLQIQQGSLYPALYRLERKGQAPDEDAASAASRALAPLGLRLEPRKMMREMLAVDSVAKAPKEN